MGKKYRRYKNFIEKYLDSNGGKRFFNIVYSVGAAIVILGAMFKILHLPFGNQMLMIGMITEAIVFLLSAFEKPAKEYKWEEVYPILSDNENFIPKAERRSHTQSEDESISSEQTESNVYQPSVKKSVEKIMNPGVGNQRTGSGGVSTVIVGGVGSDQANQSSSSASAGGSLSGNITIVGGGRSDASGSIDISDRDVTQLAQMTENMDKFAKVTESLSKISDSLQTIIGTTDGIDSNTQSYVAQMEALNRNIAGLNTIYEVQLKGISGQIHTIEHINAGLDRIKMLYDGSLADSSIFKNETEKMAKQLSELNKVYSRLLQAMTTNMNMGAGFNPNLGGNVTPQP